MEQTNKGTVLFMLGMATGALAFALTTPHSGKEIRDRVKDSLRKKRSKAEITGQNIEENLKDARDSAPDRISKTKEATEGLMPTKY